MCDDFSRTHHLAFFCSSSLFPSFFAANKIFFSSFRDLLFDCSITEKGKKPKNTRHAHAKRRKRRSDQTRGDVFYSLSLSTCVCIFYHNKARAKNGFKLYILRVCGKTPRDQKSNGPRSLGVKLAPGSKIKKATAMHAKANVALDSSTSVTSSLGA